jgi:hypothetical protein
MALITVSVYIAVHDKRRLAYVACSSIAIAQLCCQKKMVQSCTTNTCVSLQWAYTLADEIESNVTYVLHSVCSM